MMIRYLFEGIVGALCLLAVLLFGETGNVVFVLFAFLPLIMRWKKIRPDERERQLFYQAGNLTMGLTILAIMIIYYASGISLNGHIIGDHWMPLSIAAFLMIHGISGLVMLRIR